MKLFNKLANILFDEEVEEEIPVITKEEEVKEEKASTDEVIVTKVEAQKENKVKETTKEMPKVYEEVETKKFSFPFIDDDEEEEIPKRTTGKTIEDYSYASTTQEIPVIKKETPKPREERKLEKSDAYTASRNNIYEPTRNDHKPFTLSPIISPVYGILNENYTKDDIVEKNSAQKEEKIDFDSVRRKAYGTLEDEIEVNLTASNNSEDEEEVEDMTINNLKDDGISISDLLIGDEDDEKTGEIFRVDEEDEEIETLKGDEEEISIDEEETEVEESTEKPQEEEKVTEETKNEDDDLFDLIDSIYAGKDEEE